MERKKIKKIKKIMFLVNHKQIFYRAPRSIIVNNNLQIRKIHKIHF